MTEKLIEKQWAKTSDKWKLKEKRHLNIIINQGWIQEKMRQGQGIIHNESLTAMNIYALSNMSS